MELKSAFWGSFSIMEINEILMEAAMKIPCHKIKRATVDAGLKLIKHYI
ncbi:hypothetical protein [Aquiflexum sp.]